MLELTKRKIVKFFPRFAAAVLISCGGLPVTARALQVVGSVQVESPAGTVISPGTDVFVGNEIKITVTLKDDNDFFDGPLCTDPSGDPGVCLLPDCVDFSSYFGEYYIYPHLGVCQNGANLYPGNSSSPLSFVSASPLGLSSGPDEEAVAVWVFRAELEYSNLDMNIIATESEWGGSEGTGDPCCTMREPDPETLSDILADYWGGKIRIVSAFSTTAYAHVSSPGGRPPGIAYVEDEIAVETAVTNLSLAPLPINKACTANVNDSGLRVASISGQGGCVASWYEPVSPALPSANVPAGDSTSLTWTYKVQGGDTCCDFSLLANEGFPGSGTVCWDSSVEGSQSRSATMLVEAAPLSITATLWVDPDAAGPLSAIPLGVDAESGWPGPLYSMAEEILEVRATFTNDSPAYSYEIDPQALGADNLPAFTGPEYMLIDSPTAGLPYMMSPGESKEFTWKFQRDMTDQLGAYCPVSYTLTGIGILERGQCRELPIRLKDTPFHPLYNEINVFNPANFWMEGPVGVGIGEEFEIKIGARNSDSRPVTINNSATLYFGIQAFSGASVWISSYPAPDPGLPQTWMSGETKEFVYNLYSNAGGTIYVQTGLQWGNVLPSPRCLMGCDIKNVFGCSDTMIIKLGDRPAFTVTVFEGPANTTSDEVFELRLVVTNTSTTFDNLKVSRFYIQPPVVGTAVVAPSVPSIDPLDDSPVIGPGESQLFTFQVNSLCTSGPVLFGGFTQDTVEVTNLSSGGVGSVMAFTNQVWVHGAARLDCMLETDRLEYSVGMPITVRLSVTNTGEDSALNFSALVTAMTSGGAEVQPVLPLPSLPAVLAGSGVCNDPAGETAEFIFDYMPLVEGKVKFAAAVKGIDSISGATVYCTAYSPEVKIATNSRMVLSAKATPLVTLNRLCSTCVLSSECTVTGSGCISVEVLVKNEGDVSLVKVKPSKGLAIPDCTSLGCPLSLSWTGSADLYTYPAAAYVPVTVLGREETNFTWKYEPTGTGCVRFNITVWGTDQATGVETVFNVITNCVDIVDRMPVELRLVSAPSVIMRGQEFDVSIEVFNPGGTAVILRGGEPALVFISPTGASQTESFEVVLPSATTVPSGSRITVRAKVKALSGVAVGASEIRIPEMGTVFTALDAETGMPVAVRNAGAALTMEVLSAAYAFEGMAPNPFKPAEAGSVAIRYRIPESGIVRLKVYTIAGELVRTLVDERRVMAYYEDRWDGRNDKGQLCASGIYLIRLEGPSYSAVKKLALVK